MISTRQCTSKYKIRGIEACARGFLYQGKPLHRRHRRLVQMLGISTDEIARVKTNRHPCIENEYPLIDMGLSRRDCEAYLRDEYLAHTPTRSACVGCPYHSAREWAAVKAAEPSQFAEAVELDAYLRDKPDTPDVAEYYLHRRRLPLAEAVALDERQIADESLQYAFNDFINECEGHCGI